MRFIPSYTGAQNKSVCWFSLKAKLAQLVLVSVLMLDTMLVTAFIMLVCEVTLTFSAIPNHPAFSLVVLEAY